jgi:L-threonylcarbamoyladenylate synthase
MIEQINKAAQLLKAGKLVAFPTETVYGLGANALDDNAVRQIYLTKGRPSNNPLIIHVHSLDQASKYAELNEHSLLLAEHFWPGPLTMVLKRKRSNISASIGSSNTIAIRIPSHITALTLLELADIPIAAPSANRSGRISPTTAKAVYQELGDSIDMIVDGGPSSLGIESTVIDLTDKAPVILRPGFITSEDINKILTENVASYNTEGNNIIKSPGLIGKHYSPTIPVRLNARTPLQDEAFLGFGSHKSGAHLNLSTTGNLAEAAANLYTMLRSLDQQRYRGIAIAHIPYEGIGIAINDRLKRAAII